MTDSQKRPPRSTVKRVLLFSFQLLLGIGFFYAIYLFGAHISNEEKEKIDSKSGITVGRIIKTGQRKGGTYVVAEYFVKDKRFEKKESAYYSEVPVNEKYLIKYHLDEPGLCYIDFENPVFAIEDKTSINIAVITSVTDRNVCRYKYKANGMEYERFQKFPDSVLIKEGETYPVEFLVEDPIRSIVRVTE